MAKMIVLRSICRAAAAASLRSLRLAASSHQLLQHRFAGSRSFFTISPASKCFSPECRSPLVIGLGSMRHFSEDVTHLPVIEDPEVKNAFKDLMAASWDKLPHSVVQDAKKALSKNSGDKAGQEALANVIRAAEAVEEFAGILTSLKMEIDDSIGLSGENIKPLPDKLSNALSTAYERYVTYLGAFGPEEGYLRKKVEMELGTKMIHLKMRCSGLGSEWGKVTVLGTSGLSGSYVEHRA